MHTPLPIDILPQRVVSLVPSITESMFELGIGQWVVGVTDYCVYPRNSVARLVKVGGPKNVNIEKVLELDPDLILANMEENRLEDINTLGDQDIPIWEAFPLTIRDSMDDLWALSGLFQSDHAARIVRSLEDSLGWLKTSMEDVDNKAYFCPIWKETTDADHPEWMTFNKDTYMDDLLKLLGGENVFSELQLQYADDEKKKRYPVVGARQILEANPEIILLPDEPYLFGDDENLELAHIFGKVKPDRIPKIIRVEGSLIMWHGTRLAKAIEQLSSLFLNPI